ncbi:MAG: proline racemase family protein [Marivibrio sp.]|uniref:proline racemase family protein n=1 Tax=Marivibrio sp. TaxID=2039719 RepID=UPI0032EEA762
MTDRRAESGPPGPALRLAEIEVGGDVHRIILDGVTVPEGLSAHAARKLFMEEYDALRRLLLTPPYGNEDMCVDLLFPSMRPEAASAYIVMECMGYPHFSGSNTMATAAALVEYGRTPAEDGWTTVTVEAPSGLVETRVRRAAGRIEEIVIRADDAYVIEDGLTVNLPGVGRVDYALVWSGAGFVMVDADSLGVTVDETEAGRLKEIGLKLIEAVRPTFEHTHAAIGPIESIGFVHFMGPLSQGADGRFASRGATYGHPATLFYCPTGTGTAARMALETTRGRMGSDAVYDITSAHGHVFTGRTVTDETRDGLRLIGAEIAAKPYVLATTTLYLDPANPRIGALYGLGSVLAG